MRYVGAVVGAVIGFYVGGPSGALYGAELGYGVGSLIQSSNEKIVTEGPRLSDLKVTISSNGVFITRVYVHAGNIGGNIIDATNLQETTKQVTQDSGGKGGPTSVTNEHTYSASFMVLVCKSIGDRKIIRIKANGNVIWTRDHTDPVADLLATQQTVGSVIVYDGAPDQLPDPTLEAIHGVGNVPAYRGRLCVMFVDFQLAKYSNNIEATQLTFEVVEGADIVAGGPVNQVPGLAYGGSSTIGGIFDGSSYWAFTGNSLTTEPGGMGSIHDPFDVSSEAGLNNYVYRDAFDGSGPQKQGVWLTSDDVYQVLLYDDSLDGGQGCPLPREIFIKLKSTFFDGVCSGTTAAVYKLVPGYHVDKRFVQVHHSSTGVLLCEGYISTLVNDGTTRIQFYDPLGNLINYATATGFRNFLTHYNGGSQAFGYQTGYAEGGLLVYAACCQQNARDFATYLLLLIGPRQYDFTFAAAKLCGIRANGQLLYLLMREHSGPAPYSGANQTYEFNLYVMDLCHSTIDGICQPGLKTIFLGPVISTVNYAAEHYSIFVVGSHIYVLQAAEILYAWDDSGILTHQYDSTIVRTDGGETLLWTAPGALTLVANLGGHDHALPMSYPTILNAYATAVSPYLPRPWSSVFAEIAGEKNFTALDFTHLPDDVVCKGYVVTRQTSPRVAIDLPREMIRVDCAESGSKIKFVLRGGNAVRTLDADADLGAYEGDSDEPPQAVEWAIADELTQPAVVYLAFSDIDNNFEVGTAVARRETTQSQIVVKLDCTAIMMTADEAARLAAQALTDQRLASETAKFTTTYAHEVLEPADPIIVPGVFKNRRVRIDSKTDKGGVIEWTAVSDDPASLVQFVKGGQVKNPHVGDGSPGSPSGNPNGSIGVAPVSDVDILNLPSLREGKDDDGGAYLFVYPTSNAKFRGARVYDVTTPTGVTIGDVAAPGGYRGMTTTVLPPFAGVSFDWGSHVDVQMPAGTTLYSTTRAGLFNGSNVFLIGDEIVGALTTTALGSDVWRFSGLLRGLRGTQAAMTTHAAGEFVYWLTTAALLRDRVAAGAGIQVAALSQDRPTTDLKNYVTSGTSTGQALKPFAPYALAYCLGSGEALIQFKWKPRTRKIQPVPMNPPADDAIGRHYQVQISATADFSSPSFVSPLIDETLYYYDTQSRYFAYLAGATGGPFYWRVAQIGQDGKPGTFSDPYYVNPPALTFPYGSLHLSTAGPDGSTAFRDTTINGNPDGHGITVTGAVHKTSNRAVFAGGTDSISIFTAVGGTLPQRIAFQLPFETTSSAEQTLLYHGDAAFSHGSLKITMNAGRLYVWAGNFGNTAPLLLPTPTYNDGVEHVIELYSLPGGYDPIHIVFLDLIGLRVDGVVVASFVVPHLGSDDIDSVFVMGNDPFHTGEGFVGTLGDFRIS